jgi:hypothetical protein
VFINGDRCWDLVDFRRSRFPEAEGRRGKLVLNGESDMAKAHCARELFARFLECTPFHS